MYDYEYYKSDGRKTPLGCNHTVNAKRTHLLSCAGMIDHGYRLKSPLFLGELSMLQISLIAVGDKMPAWVNQATEEYAKRIHGRVTFQVIEVAAGRRGKNADVGRILVAEGQALLAAIPPNSHLIALDRLGKVQSTEQIAAKLDDWIMQQSSIAFLVGGPEGLSPSVLQAANERWSLSSMTFSHPIVRIIFAEQIYRAWSILQGLPYHR